LTFYVDEDFNKTNFFSSDTFSDTAPIVPTISQPAQRESSPLSNIIISPPPTEESHSQHINPTSMLEASHTSSSIHNGWNPLDRYNTRFKKQHIANFTPFFHQQVFNDDNLYAYLSSQDLHPFDSNNLSSTFHHTAFTSMPKDTLHFGELQSDPDRLHFETDMH